MTNDPHLMGLWLAAGVIVVAAAAWFFTPPSGGPRDRGCAWAACRATILLGLTGFGVGVLLVSVRFWAVLVLGVMVAAAIRARRWRGSGTAHGTGRYAEFRDLAGAAMLSGYGLILGRLPSSRRRGGRNRAIQALILLPYSKSREACLEFVAAFGRPDGLGQLVRLPRYTHLLTIAPTGSGKGVSYVVPTLLTYRGSIIVFDPKGELYRLTSARRRAMGQKVYRLDFFGVCGPGGDTLNVLDLVKANSPLLVDDARAMAEAFVTRTGDEKDPHWNDSAVAVLTALLSLILTAFRPEERHLGSLREIVTDPESFAGAIAKLCEAGGLLRRLGNQLRHYQGDELASVLSTTDRHTTFLDSRAVEAGLTTTSFDVRGLLPGGDTTLYVILPAEQAIAQARALRLIVSSLIRLIGREGSERRGETLVLLDEAALLQNLDSVEQALCLLRNSGLRLWLFYQSVEQAKHAFKGKESIMFDNTDTQIYFGVNSLETAQKVSAMLGEQTITNESYQESYSRSSSQGGGGGPQQQSQTGFNRSYAEQARALAKPEEILQMQQTLVFSKGVPPMLLNRVRYYDDPFFNGRPDGGQLAAAWRLALAWLLVGAMAVVAGAVVLGSLSNVR